MQSSSIVFERRQADIAKALSLTPKQSKWINGTTSNRKNMCSWFWGSTDKGIKQTSLQFSHLNITPRNDQANMQLAQMCNNAYHNFSSRVHKLKLAFSTFPQRVSLSLAPLSSESTPINSFQQERRPFSDAIRAQMELLSRACTLWADSHCSPHTQSTRGPSPLPSL